MNTVSAIKPHVQAIRCPAILRGLQAWVMWRYEPNTDNPKGKPLKVPYYASGSKRVGRQGTAEDRIQLVTFEAAKRAAAVKGMDGVGFCPLDGLGIVALDFDDCFDEDGKLLPEVEKVTIESYAEYSPSGKGIRVFFKGGPQLGNRKSHKRQGWPYGLETFSTKGFVTVTGHVTELTQVLENEDTVADLSPRVLALYELRFSKARERDDAAPANYDSPPQGLTERQMKRALDVLDPGMPYDEWIEIGMALHHETRGADQGFELWDAWSSGWPDYPGSESLRSHWDSMGHRAEGRVVTARTLVKKANENGAHIDISLGSMEDFEAMAEEPAAKPAQDNDFEVLDEAPAAPVRRARFEGYTIAQYLSRPKPSWIVKGVLPKAELGMLYGESGSGKTFITLDLALAIARGVPWRGHKVKRQRVVYIVAEGAGGFMLRLQAYLQHHGLGLHELDDWFYVIPDAPDLMEGAQVLELSQRIKDWGGAGTVFVDTLARTTPGANENSGEDMGMVLFHCQGLSRALRGAMVLLVHHSGKDQSKGSRGHSSIKAACEVQLEVKKTPLGRVITSIKQKDGEEGIGWAFSLAQVVVGQDEDGDPVTSCVCKDLDALPVQQVQQRQAKGPNEKKVAAAVDAAMQESGQAFVPFDQVIERALQEDEPYDSARQRANAKANFKRALEGLCHPETGLYQLDEDGVVHVR